MILITPFFLNHFFMIQRINNKLEQTLDKYDIRENRYFITLSKSCSSITQNDFVRSQEPFLFIVNRWTNLYGLLLSKTYDFTTKFLLYQNIAADFGHSSLESSHTIKFYRYLRSIGSQKNMSILLSSSDLTRYSEMFIMQIENKINQNSSLYGTAFVGAMEAYYFKKICPFFISFFEKVKWNNDVQNIHYLSNKYGVDLLEIVCKDERIDTDKDNALEEIENAIDDGIQTMDWLYKRMYDDLWSEKKCMS